jgi:alkanesulfonate monooxygenase SsuD/methylene tetrahydromethanopterin reductase-like flavin-dependent oxidoreductase (luciferase family)
MREYLEVLTPLLRGEEVNSSGEQYRVHGLTVGAAGADPVPVVVAALGDQMLRLAGRFAAGTITWMVGPQTLEKHTLPTLCAAAGRSKSPRVIAGFPIALTNKADEARAKLAPGLEIYGSLPSYRAAKGSTTPSRSRSWATKRPCARGLRGRAMRALPISTPPSRRSTTVLLTAPSISWRVSSSVVLRARKS